MVNTIKNIILSNKKFRKAIIRAIRTQQINTFKISNFPIYDFFELENGEKISMYKNLRGFVTPDWQKKFQKHIVNGKETNTSFDFDINLAKKEYQLYFNYFEKIILSLNFTTEGKKMLEIGSGNKLLSYLMAEKYKNATFLCSDIDSYYADLDKNEDIIFARKKVEKNFDKKIPFKSDNISSSSFEDNSFDVIFSNTVLEHIADLDNAFKEMKRILKPGGFCFHIYNPFFSYNGAHTICSIDHPWGHCILKENEYNKLVDIFYPEYADVSKSFFKHDLNKKSLNEFKKSIEKAEFKSYIFIPETNLNLMQMLLPDTLKRTLELYPTANLEDLLTSSVIVVLQQ